MQARLDFEAFEKFLRDKQNAIRIDGTTEVEKDYNNYCNTVSSLVKMCKTLKVPSRKSITQRLKGKPEADITHDDIETFYRELKLVTSKASIAKVIMCFDDRDKEEFYLYCTGAVLCLLILFHNNKDEINELLSVKTGVEISTVLSQPTDVTNDDANSSSSISTLSVFKNLNKIKMLPIGLSITLDEPHILRGYEHEDCEGSSTERLSYYDNWLTIFSSRIDLSDDIGKFVIMLNKTIKLELKHRTGTSEASKMDLSVDDYEAIYHWPKLIAAIGEQLDDESKETLSVIMSNVISILLYRNIIVKHTIDDMPHMELKYEDMFFMLENFNVPNEVLWENRMPPYGEGFKFSQIKNDELSTKFSEKTIMPAKFQIELNGSLRNKFNEDNEVNEVYVDEATDSIEQRISSSSGEYGVSADSNDKNVTLQTNLSAVSKICEFFNTHTEDSFNDAYEKFLLNGYGILLRELYVLCERSNKMVDADAESQICKFIIDEAWHKKGYKFMSKDQFDDGDVEHIVVSIAEGENDGCNESLNLDDIYVPGYIRERQGEKKKTFFPQMYSFSNLCSREVLFELFNCLTSENINGVLVEKLLQNMEIMDNFDANMTANDKRAWLGRNMSIYQMFDVVDFDKEYNSLIQECESKSKNNVIAVLKKSKKCFIGQWQNVLKQLSSYGITCTDVHIGSKYHPEKNIKWTLSNDEHKHTTSSQENMQIYGIKMHGIEIYGDTIRFPNINVITIDE